METEWRFTRAEDGALAAGPRAKTGLGAEKQETLQLVAVQPGVKLAVLHDAQHVRPVGLSLAGQAGCERQALIKVVAPGNQPGQSV